MNFNFSEEQDMLRDGVARFVQDSYGLEQRRHLVASEAGYSPENWQQFAELGWLALNLPEDVGGLELDFVDTSVVMEELGRGMVLEPFLTTVVLCADLIDRSGNAHWRETLLPSVIEGQTLLALAYQEAGGAGIPSLTPATTAQRSGEGYTLDGSKTLAFHGPSATQLLVTATLDGAPAIFVVAKDAGGLTQNAYRLINGMPAADFTFAAVSLPADALLVADEAAAAALAASIDRARLAAMAMAVGAMEACMETTSEYIKQRVQFKQTLSKFQSLQHLMADMFVDAQQSRSMVYQGLAFIGADAPARTKAVMETKLVVGQAGRRVSASGIQMHGGYGITDEYAVSHHYRELHVLDHLFGSSDELLRSFPVAED